MPRANCHTALAAAMGTAAELSRRGYDVAFTLGNTPRIDLLCNLPDGDAFKVQVKGIGNAAGFFIGKSFFEKHDRGLFLVVVYVPKTPLGDDERLRFFILSHREAMKEFRKMPRKTRDGREFEDGPGLNWGSVVHYEDCWTTFPRRKRR